MIDCNKDLNDDILALLEERVDTVVADKKKWNGDFKNEMLNGKNLVLIDNDAQMLLDNSQIEKLEGRMWYSGWGFNLDEVDFNELLNEIMNSRNC